MYKNAQHEGKGQIIEDDEEEPEPQDEDPVEDRLDARRQQPPLQPVEQAKDLRHGFHLAKQEDAADVEANGQGKVNGRDEFYEALGGGRGDCHFVAERR